MESNHCKHLIAIRDFEARAKTGASCQLRLRNSFSTKTKKAKSDSKAPRPHQIGYCKGNSKSRNNKQNPIKQRDYQQQKRKKAFDTLLLATQFAKECYQGGATRSRMQLNTATMVQLRQDTLADGWKSKDNFNLELYQV